MQDEKDEFDEIKQALSEQKEMNAALSDSIEEQKKIFEKFEEDEEKVLSSIKSHSEKFRLGFVLAIADFDDLPDRKNYLTMNYSL